MRVPTRAREISFTFTPRLVQPTFAEWGRRHRQPGATSFVHASGVCIVPLPSHGGGDSLAQTLTPAPNRCLLPLPQIKRLRSPPNRLFRSRRPPCRKGDNVEQKLRFRRCTVGRQWGRGAFCAHRDDEGLKWTAVVQVGFH